MTSSLRSIAILAAILSLLVSGATVFAQGFDASQTGLPEAAQSGGYNVNQPCVNDPGGCIPQVIGNVISVLLGIFGALFLALLMWGGAQYMLSSGNEEKTKAARATIANAVIGMLVVAASYAIATFVITAVGQATGADGGAST